MVRYHSIPRTRSHNDLVVLEGLPKEIQRDFTRIRQIESSSKRNIDNYYLYVINA